MSFYQKAAAEETANYIEIQKVYSENSDKCFNYVLYNDKETLAYLNNLDCIELNVSTSRIQKADHPDYLFLDLDPSEKNSLEDIIKTAQVVEEVFDLAGIVRLPINRAVREYTSIFQ